MTDLLTADLSTFGNRELLIASDLLRAYAENRADFLGENITLNFNPNSGYVFLSDEDYRVGILADDENKVVEFFSCPVCGYEGTQEEAKAEGKDFEGNDGYCSKDCSNENDGK